MADAYIRTGDTRNGFTIMYHDLFDLYHPYIGDKATLYYMYLARYRNNEEGNANKGMAWKGRQAVVEKFQLSFSTLKVIDEILEASGLVTIERKPVGRGKDKIYYVVHDPVEREKFRAKEADIKRKLTQVAHSNKKTIGKLLGKELGAKLLAG